MCTCVTCDSYGGISNDYTYDNIWRCPRGYNMYDTTMFEVPTVILKTAICCNNITYRLSLKKLKKIIFIILYNIYTLSTESNKKNVFTRIFPYIYNILCVN